MTQFQKLWAPGDWTQPGVSAVDRWVPGLGPSRLPYGGHLPRREVGAKPCPRTTLRSQRDFKASPLAPHQLQTLAASLCGSPGGMPYASAGALYPVHVYAFEYANPSISEVVYLDTAANALISVSRCKTRTLSSAVFEKWAWPVGVLFVTVIDFRRVCGKYGARGVRFSLLEAGAVLHVLRQAATEISLSHCIVGGFNDTELLDILELESSYFGVASLLAVGAPNVSDA